MGEITLIQKEKLLKSASGNKWERMGIKRRAGILTPLFSIYSKESIGIADFSDLRLLIDWAGLTGHSIVQLLPLNEMGGLFCPYDALSGFALEPMYISLKPFLEENREVREDIERIKINFYLKGEDFVDYRIKERKLVLLWRIFQKEKDRLKEDYFKFKRENSYWLEDFSLFKVIKRKQRNLAWYEWEHDLRDRKTSAIKNFINKYYSEVEFENWLQFIAHEQLKEVKLYANQKGILLKGDLPILVSRDSVDVWAKREFFKLEYASGAPPDMYCALGQRWGMSPYNWKEIGKDNFNYLKEKLKYAQNFYDILRIDHVVGLFRIWTIPYEEPLENQGLNGFFDPQ
ncbi:MAG: 4-alpha-glucanotransferase, partial [Candidatus Omnitrophica bacterium]|nr:4-alpha-glucanotransferase [Candidatus Omnitrophota bacterium]